MLATASDWSASGFPTSTSTNTTTITTNDQDAMFDECELQAFLAEIPDEPLCCYLDRAQTATTTQVDGILNTPARKRKLESGQTIAPMPPLTALTHAIVSAIAASVGAALWPTIHTTTSSPLQVHLQHMQEQKRQRQRLYEKRYRAKRRKFTKNMSDEIEALELHLQQLLDQNPGVYVVPSLACSPSTAATPEESDVQPSKQQLARRQKLRELLEAKYEERLLQQEMKFWSRLQQALISLQQQHARDRETSSDHEFWSDSVIETLLHAHLSTRHFSF